MNATEKDNVFYCDCGFSWRRGMSGSHNCEDGLRAKLTDMAVQLANAESKCMALAARTVTLPDVEKWRSVDAVRAQNAYKVLISKVLADAGIGVKGD